MIPIIAIVFGGGGEATDDVGVGAILGAPFMLSTLAMFVTGVGVIYWRRRRATGTRMVVDTDGARPRHPLLRRRLRAGDRHRLPAARAELAAGSSVAVVLIGIYAWYVKGHFDAEARRSTRTSSRRCASTGWTGAAHRDDPAVPRLRIVSAPGAVRARLHHRRRLPVRRRGRQPRDALGVSEILLALVIAPIATELPEKFNSLIWVRQGKDTLAMGNITGAMVFQSAIPTVVALVLRRRRLARQRGLADRVPVGRDRVPRGRGDLRADVAPRRASTAARCSSAGLLYLVYLALVGLAHRGRRRRPAEPGPTARPGRRERRVLDSAASRGTRGRAPHATWSRPMLTQQPSATAAPRRAPAQARSLDDLIAYFEGDYVPLRDAKVSIMTHAFMYGTATFEGIRGYWNAEQGTLYVLFVREHVERIRNSAKMLLMEDLPSVGRAGRRSSSRRSAATASARTSTSGPSFYKSTRAIGVRLHHLDHELYVITTPFGNYIDIEKGVRVMTSTWRRNADEALPARGKIVGGYVNMAFQKSEAELNGFDEALVLTPDGHASEASAANLFVVRDGVAAHAAGVGRHPRGRDPQGDHARWPQDLGHPGRRSARSTAPSSTSATRCSCAGPASR